MYGEREVKRCIAKRAEVRKVAGSEERPSAFVREIEQLSKAAQRGDQNRTLAREWKIHMQGSVSFPAGVSGGLARNVDLFWAADWSLQQIPGNGYRKLLLGLIAAQDELDNLSGRLRAIWEASYQA
jgi:hypothetical protein